MAYKPRTASADCGAEDDWRHRSACRDADPELFWPVGSGGLAEAQIQEALGFCRVCQVREVCTQSALARGETDGVWGVHPDDLKTLRYARARYARAVA